MSPAFTFCNRLIGWKVYPESIPELLRGSDLFVVWLPTDAESILSHTIVPSRYASARTQQPTVRARVGVEGLTLTRVVYRVDEVAVDRT